MKQIYIKDIKVGDAISWVDGAGFTQRRTVEANEEGTKCVKVSTLLRPVSEIMRNSPDSFAHYPPFENVVAFNSFTGLHPY